jgi:hypothetical protein
LGVWGGRELNGRARNSGGGRVVGRWRWPMGRRATSCHGEAHGSGGWFGGGPEAAGTNEVLATGTTDGVDARGRSWPAA